MPGETNRRATLLMAVLLLALMFYAIQNVWPRISRPKPPPVLAGTNSISGLKVEQDKAGAWFVSFDSFYTGAPQGGHLVIEAPVTANGPTPAGWPDHASAYAPLKRGANHVRAQLHQAGLSQVAQSVTVSIKAINSIVASQTLQQRIEWPDAQTAQLNRDFAESTPEALLTKAVNLIDLENGRSREQARAILERLVRDDVRMDAAYVELARVAMKGNWGTEGLHQAEGYLQTALDVRPDSPNAKILLGYVYAHQRKFAAAEALFREVSAMESSNLYLWTNWGEVLVMQRKFDAGIAKYREALSRPQSHDTYDRARLDAYYHLLLLLEQRGDLDGMDVLHRQRIAEFGAGRCWGTSYADFLLKMRGDTTGAITYANKALDSACTNYPPRELLGMSYYLEWSRVPADAKAEQLAKARTYLPPGARMFYALASSDKTSSVIRKLAEVGESIEARDNEDMTALAYALSESDLNAARRLLKAGARADAKVGPAGMPVSFLPVIEGNVEGIKLMQASGIDYGKLTFNGHTAYEVARATGNPELQKQLGQAGQSL